MVIIDFEDRLGVRIKAEDIKMIKRIVRKNKDMFYNKSHFIRSSILKYIREFDNKGNKNR